MGSAKTKVRIFSIWLTSVIIMVTTSTVINMGLVQDANTVEVLLFAGFMAALVTIAAMYAGLVMFIEGLLLKWANKVFEAQQENDYTNQP